MKALLVTIRIIRFVFLLACGVSAFVIGAQDILIFPRAAPAFLKIDQLTQTEALPNGKSHRIRSPDGAELELLEVRGVSSDGERGNLVFFHGNGNIVSELYDQLRDFSAQGFRVFAPEYRGYGKSTGWPSEAGLFLDVERVKTFLDDAGIQGKDTLVLGHSIGGAPAAYLATRMRARSLALASTYSRLDEVVSRRPFFKLYSNFLWHKLSTKSFVAELRTTCFFQTHGTKDPVIPLEAGKDLAAAYQGTGIKEVRVLPGIGHSSEAVWQAFEMAAANWDSCKVAEIPPSALNSPSTGEASHR